MSKIVQAVNAMIANPDFITQVIKSESEIFFEYKGRYKWSIRKREDGIVLWFYPGRETLDTLAAMEAYDWDDSVPMVQYRDSEIGTKEAKASFSELLTMLGEKVYGIQEALDDIISDGPDYL